jgi:hypothetical protein
MDNTLILMMNVREYISNIMANIFDFSLGLIHSIQKCFKLLMLPTL